MSKEVFLDIIGGTMENENHAILIVEDEPDLREVLSDLLYPSFRHIHLAGDGREALEKLAAYPQIVAILSDVQMPNMNGLELLASLRASFNPIPFVILTAFGEGSKFREAVRLNATDFLAKPIDPAVLASTMQNAVEYGIQLKTAEIEVEELIQERNVPSSQVDSIKRVQMTLRSMRIQNSVYIKEAKKGD